MNTLWLLPLLSASLAAQNWVPTFADDFNGTALDLSRWSPHDPFGETRDRQLQAYVGDAVTVSGGQLHIAARRTPADQPVKYDGRNREYLSGVISTFGMFAQTFGRFEIRFRAPAGQGLRPGFLLLPVPAGTLPQIDVFETAGSAPTRIFVGNRWGTEHTERSWADSFTVADLSNGFHTVAIEWDRDHLTWFVDGKKTFESTEGIPRQQMYMLIDLAVGGRLAHAPDGTTSLPASLDVDYVKVYKRPKQ
jgi:beta-glucanase (GH16 family)